MFHGVFYLISANDIDPRLCSPISWPSKAPIFCFYHTDLSYLKGFVDLNMIYTTVCIAHLLSQAARSLGKHVQTYLSY